MLSCNTAAYGFFLLLILSHDFRVSGVVSNDVTAIFNSEKWSLVNTEADAALDEKHRPPKASESWKNPDAEIFVSIVEYRDSRCPVTLKNLFTKAYNPKRIFVGEICLIQVTGLVNRMNNVYLL
jgi:Glycosyltransferase (GlcNAc)